MFASQSQANDKSKVTAKVMIFDDLIRFYILMKYQLDEDLAEFSFELIKRQPEQEDLGREDILNFCKKIAQMSEIYVSDFYSWTKFDPDARITKSEYIERFDSFKKVKFI